MLDTVVQETWGRILERLQEEIGEKLYTMWFEHCRVLALKRGVLMIGVPNLFVREWIQEHYGDLLCRLSEEVLGTRIKLAVRVDPDLFRAMGGGGLPLGASLDTDAEPGEGKSLASFLITPGHARGVAALKHVSQGKAPPMNPLLIVGSEGTGKTHLASATVHLYKAGTTFFRLRGEEFARRFAWNLKTRRIASFRDEITCADVVIVDDVQVLAGKAATQRELSSLVQDLVARGNQAILFCSQAPQEIAGLDVGLRSVLLSGMLVELEAPDQAATIDILEKVLQTAHRRVPRAVITLVVERVGGSVKRLDRLIRKLYAFASLTGELVDGAFLDRHLEEVAGPADPGQRRLDIIFSMLEDHFAVDRTDLLSRSKTRVLSVPRGVAVYLLREQGGLTFKEVGRCLGNRSHTSAYLLFKKYEQVIRQDPELRALVKETGRRLVTAG